MEQGEQERKAVPRRFSTAMRDIIIVVCTVLFIIGTVLAWHHREIDLLNERVAELERDWRYLNGQISKKTRSELVRPFMRDFWEGKVVKLYE